MPPSNLRRAVIDVGTNSVKLLVADVCNGSVLPLIEKSDQTRLGRGFYPAHELQREAIDQTARAVAQFAEEARALAPESIRVIGTSAARDARNQAELAQAIESSSGLRLEIISGQQEADWVYSGVTTDPCFHDRTLLIVDIGGGSTEFILGHGPTPSFRQSFPLGTVRLYEEVQPRDPPAKAEFDFARQIVSTCLEMLVQPALQPALNQAGLPTVWLIGTGGTTTILAGMKLQLQAFDREKLESTNLSLAEVDARERQLWNLPLAARKMIPGLPPNRADVILMGVTIIAEIMRRFGLGPLRPTTRGIRFAVCQG